jgi:hypothetical protein
MYFQGPLWDQLYRVVKHLKLSHGLRTPKEMLTVSILMLLYFLGITTTKRVLLPITGEVSEQCFLLAFAVIYVPRLNEQWQQHRRENFLVMSIISPMLISDALAVDHVVCPLEASSQMEFRPLLVMWVLLQMYLSARHYYKSGPG